MGKVLLMPDTSTTIFFAGLAVAVVVAKLVLRSGGAAGGSSSSNRGGAASTGPREVTDDMVSVVSVLVPHASREAIRKDLEQTHNIELTTERLQSKKQDTLLNKYAQESSPSPQTSTPPPPEGWINDRVQREERLRLQRQQMVLKARQRTQEMEKTQ